MTTNQKGTEGERLGTCDLEPCEPHPHHKDVIPPAIGYKNWQPLPEKRGTKMARRYSYDPACEGLAEHFLQDENPKDGELAELSQDIQDAVEAFMSNRGETRE